MQPPASLPAHTRVQSPWRRGFWERGDFKRWSGEGSEKDRHIGHVRSVRCTLGVGRCWGFGRWVGHAASAASGDMVNGLLCLSISVSGRGLSGYGRRRANAPGPLYFGACSLNFRTFSEHSPNISRTCSHPPRAHHAAELVPTIFRTLAEHPPSISLHIFVDCSAWVYTRPQATQLSPQLVLFEREPRSSSHLAGVAGFPICFRAPEGRKGCPGRRSDAPTSPTSGVGSHLLRLEFRLLGFSSASRMPLLFARACRGGGSTKTTSAESPPRTLRSGTRLAPPNM